MLTPTPVFKIVVFCRCSLMYSIVAGADYFILAKLGSFAHLEIVTEVRAADSSTFFLFLQPT